MKIFEEIKKNITNLYMGFILKNQKIDKGIYSSSTTKYAVNSCCTLKLSADTETKKNEINDKLKKLVKKYINSPEQLMNYMQMQGISLYKIKKAKEILSIIGEEEGFITPLKGFKSFYLNIMLMLNNYDVKLLFNTKAMFIFNINNTEIYTIARALHKFYGYKNNLPGFDYKSQEVFKKIYGSQRSRSIFMERCTINEIYACKEAIARDLESINFTLEISREYENAKKTLKKIKNEKSANL